MSTTHPQQFDFLHSQTCRNLASAFRGEAQARRQYHAAAERLDQAGLHVAAYAFRFTAAQEGEHAAILHGLLCVSGGSRITPAEDDIPLPEMPLDILNTAARGETDESEKLYPAYARIADEEGYPRIAATFRRIAETERLHARRFTQYADALKNNTLFRSPARVGWLCLPCGHLHYAHEAPALCDTCGRTQGHFIRNDFHPFTVGT